MIFLHPEAWLWALLGVPLVLLHLRRRRPRSVSVAAGFLWQQVLVAGGPRRRRPRWRRTAPAAVDLAVLLLIVAAMAEPAAGPSWSIALAATALAVLTAQWYLFQRQRIG